MVVYLIITRNCNYACDFCIRRNLVSVSRTMDLEAVKKVLNKIKEAFPNAVIVLTGGEPLLHADVFFIIELACSMFEKVILTSNGSFSIKTAKILVPFLKKNLWLQFSLDGIETVHDRIRGKGLFSKVISNLILLENEYQHVMLSTTVTKETLLTITQLADELNNYKFAFWKVSPIQLEHPTIENLIPSEEWNDFAYELLQHCKFYVHIKQFFNFKLMDKALELGIESPSKNCGCGIDKLYVDCSGHLLLCSCFSFEIGNIFYLSAKEMKFRAMKYGIIKVHPHSVCADCKYLKLCNGGCPGYSLKVFGRNNMGDIRCPFIQKKIING